jgi:thioredoxin-like negative regulator of GroEL
MPGWIDVQVEGWDREVSGSEKPVVVEFWHQRCSSCQRMEPVLERLPIELGNDTKLVRMNVLESKENRVFAIKLGVRSTPTFMMLCGGRPIGSIVGERSLDQLVKEITDLLEIKGSCLASTPLE